MVTELRKLARSLQVYFPELQDYRFGFQRRVRSLLGQPHEYDFHLLQHLPYSPGQLFIDIGANRGDAIQSILTKRPQAKIVAFEPNPILVGKIRKVFYDNESVTIEPFGLGSETSTFTLNIPFYRNYMFDGLASFKEENARDWLKNRMYGYQPEKLVLRQIPCTVKRLDEFGLRPSFIKIDVQGFEYEVLLGAQHTIEQARPVLLIESPGRKEKDFLSGLGYRCFTFVDGTLIENKPNYNIFFIPDEMISALRKNLSIQEAVQEEASQY